jgi:hypothetical protein
MRNAVVFALALASCVRAPSQSQRIESLSAGESGVWSQVTALSLKTPMARLRMGMAFDSTRNRTVLYGGDQGNASANAPLGDTWVYDGTNWTSLTPAKSPPARESHGMAYDSMRDRVVVFGGDAATGVVAETWEFDGTTWSQPMPTNSPGARDFPAMAYDSSRHKTVLFGGTGLVGGVLMALGDTWEWDGTNWTNPSNSGPPGKSDAAMAFDSHYNITVLLDSGTWEWNGGVWTQANASMGGGYERTAFDSKRNALVLWSYPDTWEWNGFTWQVSATTGPTMNSYNDPGFAFDSARNNVVLFGGGYPAPVAETWLYHTHGGACTSVAQCDTGFCTDGVCCEQASCTGMCSACNVQGVAGVCATVSNGTTASCNGTNYCNATGTCVVRSGNGGPCANGAQCTSNFCVGGICCATLCAINPCSTCATGSCVVTRNGDTPQCNGPDTCDANGQCRVRGAVPSCVSDTDCTSPTVCVGGLCLMPQPNGAACGLTEQCASGFCPSGICCDTACMGDPGCVDCLSGTCNLHARGTACGSGLTCDGNGKCSAAGHGGCAFAARAPLDGAWLLALYFTAIGWRRRRAARAAD